jgi:phosphonate transport system substrate-binding protein
MPELVKKRLAASRVIRLLFAISAIVLVGSMLACRSSQQSGGNPSVIRYAFAPSEEEMQDNSERAELMSKYLTAQLHIPVEIIKVSGYAPTIEAMHTGKVDIATFGPLGYIIASQKAGAEAIVASGGPDGKLGTYNSIIAVPKSSPLQSIADLKAHAKSLTFMFVDPASTSGYLIPRAYLQTIGINPDTDFGKVVFAGSQLAAILTIKAGKIDAGSVMEEILIPRLIALGKLAPGDLRILWTSDPIPHSPICVRSSLPAPLKEKIQQALLEIPQKDPALWETIKKTYRQPDMTFVAVKDSTYDGLRKFADQVKGFNFTEK